MIQPLQQTLLRGLGEVCELSPDVRFGQMLDFLGFLAQDATDRPLAEIEDDELLRVIENHRANLLKRQASPSEPRA